MIDALLSKLEARMQIDVGNRGLATIPGENLLSATRGEFSLACRDVAAKPGAHVGIVTGFFIPGAMPPTGETDGPLGAVFLARCLVPLGYRVSILSDAFCTQAVAVGLGIAGVAATVCTLPAPAVIDDAEAYRRVVRREIGDWDILIAIERGGPAHADGRVHTMRGLDITDCMSPAHWLFDGVPSYTTIGIGDGGNEIGMGKLPRSLIAKNIPRGDLVACRVSTDRLLVAGISNWGAYALCAGVCTLLGRIGPGMLWDAKQEEEILRAMVESGPLVDGVLGIPSVSVDGIAFAEYASILPEIGSWISHEPR